MFFRLFPVTACIVGLWASSFSVQAEPAKVTIQKAGDGKAILLVNGEPFEINGVGGETQLPLLKSLGGNAIRTWGIEDTTMELLDEAHANGLKVALGYWLGHERHGFEYTNWDSTLQQAEGLFDAVKKFKDHPAVLLWGLGNEMEGFTLESNPAIYTHIEYLAREVKKIDPNHPTMTVTAEIGKRQIEALNRYCPSIDIHGINSYGGIVSIPRRYREKGGVKPYIITEYGPRGTWETKPNKWGMPDEISSTEKAAFYRRAYETVHADPLCLGSFAFLWGTKQESSATWFGMLLPTGQKLACVDELSELWTGKAPENYSPKVDSMALVGPNELLDPGSVIEVKLETSDPENDPISVKWVLAECWKETAEGGDHRPVPPKYPNAILPETRPSLAKIQIPQGGGTYRIYAYITDGKGGGATANVSINVKGERQPAPAEKLELPLLVAGAKEHAPWVPSGWMGDTGKITMEEQSRENPKVGDECLKVNFTSDSGWGGVVWQHPASDWGDAPGGFNLTGAEQISFWARGGEGGEKVSVGIGLIGDDKLYSDTVKQELKLELSKKWVKYQIDLSDEDLTRVKSALFFSTSSQGKPFSFFLDEVVIE